MKQQLLLFFVLCFPIGIFAQATAYPVPNIEQCGNNVFNLNAQTPIVLGGQGPFPGQFEVFYYTSLAGAQTGSSEGYLSFAAAANYTVVGTSGTSQVIYIRVQNAVGNASDVTSFFISINDIPPMIGMPDIVACGAFILPPPVPGTSFNTGPNGTNPPVENPYFYTMYVHNVNGPCSSDYPFTVTIASPGPYPAHDVSACGSYVLPNIDAFYFDNAEGTGINIQSGTQITSSTTLYVVPPASETCLETNSFDIHIGSPQVNQPTTPLYGCFGETAGLSIYDFHTKFFEITTVLGHTFSVHTSLIDAQNNEGALNYEAPINISTAQTVYIRVSNGGNCFSVVTLDLIPESCTQNVVYGEVHYDAANNGCSEGYAFAANVEVIRTDATHAVSTYTDIYGSYYFLNIPGEENTLTVVPPVGFAAAPITQTVASTGTMNFYEAQPICLSVANSVNDIEIALVPNGAPRPGNDVIYSVYITNLASTAVSGVAVLQFDASKLDFNYSPAFNLTAANTLTFDFTNLLPLQVMGGGIVFTVKPQPDVALGDQLIFTATVAPVPADDNMSNNTAAITQTVVNSLDPNDIVVQEGEFINLDQVDDYLHYTIRFQNEGTAEAQNIRISNRLSDYLDWATFTPIGNSSMVMRTERVAGDVSFVFDGIDLAPNPTNNPNLVGFVSYKIKPLPGFGIGDIISNEAAIYFDDNAPITTNTVTTQIQNLGVAESELDTLKIYPNPSKDLVYIALQSVSEKVSVKVYDVQGKVILDANQNLIDGRASVEVSKIQSGIYFMKVSADGKSAVKKWIKL